MLVAINLVIAEQAYSTHYSGYRWFLSSINTCYDSYSLKNINIDGNTNQFSKVASELDQGRNSWNNLPSQFTLNRVSNCNNWVTGEYHDTMWLGIVSQYQFGYIVDADMIINTKYNYKTAPECYGFLYGYTLDYVARHEWGHYVEFNDYPSNTVMYPKYNCDYWNSIKSHDSSSVSNIYG